MDAASSSLVPFAWVYKRDGRLVPFEADKISRSLFAATESLGRPDAFLARELTDGILHFLESELSDPTPTTGQIEELVVKVVRELGQPPLAQAFAEFARQRPKPDREARAERPDTVSAFLEQGPPPDLAWQVGGAALRDYALRRVFTRDLVAAQASGLLTLAGLEAPFELAGCVLGPARGTGLRVIEALEEARTYAGEFLALDGPEYALASSPSARDAAGAYVRELGVGLRATRLRAVVNLNLAAPPFWADNLAEGPLFASHRRPAEPGRLAEVVDALLDEFLNGDAGKAVRVDWHLGERDFLPVATDRLTRLAHRAMDDGLVAFVFDRPGRPVALAEGLDRNHPAALLAVGLHLPRLVEQLGGAPDAALFLQKLGSLARLALSAAVQKRDFLRRHSQDRPGVTRGFLLDRARLVVVPVGLETCVRALLGRGPCTGGAAAGLARQVVHRLHTALRQDGQACHLETCLDGFTDAAARGIDPEAGLTAWAATASPAQQLRAASALHAVAEGGTALVLLPPDRPPSPDDVTELLQFAWQQTKVVRLRFLRPVTLPRQLTAPWEV